MSSPRPTDTPNPSGVSFFRKIKHQQVHQPLFTKTPAISDISQGGNTGDCFLLASILAILALPNGDESIRSMMQDNDTHVIVRLFDDYQKPHHLRIEKSVPSSLGVLNKGALWVKMLEKAYAVFHQNDYRALSEGLPEFAIKSLTGAVNHHSLNGYCNLPFQSRNKLISLTHHVDGNGIFLFNEVMRLDNATPEKIQNRILREIFNNRSSDYDLWQQWIKRKQHQWKELLKHTHPVLISHIKSFMLEYEDSHHYSATQIVMNWVINQHILSGEPLSGEYNIEELALFDNMQNRFINQHPMTISTSSDCKNGLLPHHTYAVVGIENNPVTYKKYIHVCNPIQPNQHAISKLFIPGGRKSVDIQKDNRWTTQIQPSKEPLVRMELSDFCSSFAYIDYFDCASKEAMNQRAEMQPHKQCFK